MVTPWCLVLMGLLAVVSTTAGQKGSSTCILPHPSACDHCTKLTQDVGYLNHPCDQKKFLQCHQGTNGWVYNIIDCPVCTVWDQTECTCVHDKNLPRNYNCPITVVIEEYCKAQNYHQITAPENNGVCRVQEEKKKSHPYSTCYYQQHVDGNWLTRPCPPGTGFVLAYCCCLAGQSEYCPPNSGMCMHFDKGWNGLETTNNIWVQDNSNVIVTKDLSKAYFNGNGHLEIPYFKNTEWTKFYASIQFKLDKFDGTQGLLDNGNCESQPTFSIYVTPADQNFLTVFTRTDGGSVTITMPLADYVTVSSWFTVDVYYTPNWLTVNVLQNGHPIFFDEAYLAGIVHTEHSCPLVIGALGRPPNPEMHYFTGYMDSVCLAINHEVKYPPAPN